MRKTTTGCLRHCILALSVALVWASCRAASDGRSANALPQFSEDMCLAPVTLKINEGRQIQFANPLPRMRVDDHRVGSSNSDSFMVPGVATTSDASLGDFVKTLRDTVRRDRRKVFVQDRTLTCSINWIRDHIHQSVAFRHWESDMTSFLDYILDTQRDDGQFYEMLLPMDRDGHWRNSDPSCYRLFPDDFLSLVRFETESDIEYLMVEGCERVWRATGADVWLKSALPRLEKGIDYMMSDPKRWDAAHGLVKRPYTIDTWDFTFRQDPDTGADLRRIIPGYTPMSITHGDNTGLYSALVFLAEAERRFGRAEKSAIYEAAAARLKQSIFRHLWNGRHFLHQLPIDPPQARDGHERERLSLSNAYALNRGILSLDERRAIIGEYIRRREATSAFAEWLTIDPPYEPCFGENGKFPSGQYMNGAVSPVAAGELARGAFQSGFESYGWDIIRRLMELVAKDGRLFFLYDPKTKEGQGRGPAGWAAASVLNAIDEGLAGIVDVDTCYREISFSPRWPATPYKEVRYVTGYEVTGAYVDCRYILTDEGMRYHVKSPATRVRAHLLLPQGSDARLVRVDGREVAFDRVAIGDSSYLDFVVMPTNELLDVEVLFGQRASALDGTPLSACWQLPHGSQIEGDVLTIGVPVGNPQSAKATASVDLSAYDGKAVEISVAASGRDVVAGEKKHFGFKVQLSYVDPATGERCHRDAASATGTWSNRVFRIVDGVPAQSRMSAVLSLGLEHGAGTVMFDLKTLRAFGTKPTYPRINQDKLVGYPDRVTQRPLLRGVMLPGRIIREKDFADLKALGATLVRYQMNPAKPSTNETETIAAYRTGLAFQLERLERDVLPLARKYGMQVVVDLHSPPGGRYVGDGGIGAPRDMKMFFEQVYGEEFIRAWKEIATRVRGNEDVIYGYDLINEPDQKKPTAYRDYLTLQSEAAELIRSIDPDTTIIVEANMFDNPEAFSYLSPLALDNVVYQVHMYRPHEFTHQRIGANRRNDTPTVYPDDQKGWNRAFLEKKLLPVRKFAEKHRARIFVGEFSAYAWSEGADKYLADCISLFEEYGWDWTYHAFREHEGWSVEHEWNESQKKFEPSSDNARRRVVFGAFAAKVKKENK